MMRYKGYVGIADVDMEAGVIRGKVVNTRDTITFQGKTVEEARKAFEESVDDYLEFCVSLGEKPEKPFSGKFLVRITPAVHRDLTAAAQAKGVSVNRFVGRALYRLAKKSYAFSVTKKSDNSYYSIKKTGDRLETQTHGSESPGAKVRTKTARKPTGVK
jgi:predicted HicB family RNase H-like nuclease